MGKGIFKTILLTGAGFSKNFGGFLAQEMWGEIFRHEEVKKYSRIGTISTIEHDFDYESIYHKVYRGSEYTQEEKNAIHLAIKDAYKNLDRNIYQTNDRNNPFIL
jgi:dihydroxyacetone kinase-like predicted kinase